MLALVLRRECFGSCVSANVCGWEGQKFIFWGGWGSVPGTLSFEPGSKANGDFEALLKFWRVCSISSTEQQARDLVEGGGLKTNFEHTLTLGVSLASLNSAYSLSFYDFSTEFAEGVSILHTSIGRVFKHCFISGFVATLSVAELVNRASPHNHTHLFNCWEAWYHACLTLET